MMKTFASLNINRVLICFLFVSMLTRADAQGQKILQTGVIVEIASPVAAGSLFHWKITNKLEVAVYVYDFYLWGPAYHIQHTGNRVTIETAPVTEMPGCPPNRFPPVLLLVVGPRRTIEGDFSDPELNLNGKTVSLLISVGEDPFSVVEAAKQFANSRCKHSPYDAIVRWGTVLESNPIEPK